MGRKAKMPDPIQAVLDEAKTDSDTLTAYLMMACLGIYPDGSEKGKCENCVGCFGIGPLKALVDNPFSVGVQLVKCMKERGYKYKKPVEIKLSDLEAMPEKDEPDAIELEAPEGVIAAEGIEADNENGELFNDKDMTDAILDIEATPQPPQGKADQNKEDEKDLTLQLLEFILSNHANAKKAVLTKPQQSLLSIIRSQIENYAITEAYIDEARLSFLLSFEDYSVSVNGMMLKVLADHVYGLNGMEPKNRGLPDLYIQPGMQPK